MRTVTLSTLRAHAPRLLASMLAIVVGVAFLAAVLIGTASARSAVYDVFGQPYQGADLVVESRGQQFGPAQQHRIGRADGVAAAALLGQGSATATLPGSDRPTDVSLQSVPADALLAWQDVQSGRLPRSATEVAVPPDTGKPALTVGDHVRIVGPEGHRVRLTVTGVLEAGADSWALTPAGLAATAGARDGSQVIVRLAPDASFDAATAGIHRVLAGTRVAVLTPAAAVDEQVRGITHGIDVLGAMLAAFGLIAAVVTGIVIANTYAIVLAARTRQMALLRAVGATRGQVLRSTMAEASLLGMVGGAAGVGVGYLLVQAVLLVCRLLDLGVPPVPVRPDLRSLAVPFLVGVVVTVVAALAPARRAAAVRPVAALTPDLSTPTGSRTGVVRLLIGVFALLAGVAALFVGARNASVLVGVVGGLVSFVGVLLLGPVLVPAGLRLLGLLPGRLGAVPGRLAAANAVRNPHRSAATSSALLVGTTLIVTMTVGVASTQATFDHSIDEARPVDLVLDHGGTAMPRRVSTELAKLDGIAATTTVHTGEVRIAGAGLSVPAVGLDPSAVDVLRGDVFAHVHPGSAVVSSRLLTEIGLRDGQTARLRGPGGARMRVTVHAGTGVGELALAASDLKRLVPHAPASQVWAQAGGGVDVNQLMTAVTAVAGADVSVSGGLAERSVYQSIFATLLKVAVGLLAVSVLIALIGVGNTLSLSVLERLRENALLRALGLTRAQLRGTLAIEAVLVCAVAAVLGIVLGVGYGWAGTAALMGVTGYAVQYAVPWGWLAATVLVALAAGLVASVLPARRAAAIAPAHGLTSE